MGAVGSAAPWFLTGWAEEVEIEFMIDTGCQVTILATSVSERMCASDSQVRSRLRPCGRRMVSADSSLLTIKGELEITIIFPGLSCDMLLMVASIGSDACWVRQPCIRACHISWICERGNCGRKVDRRYSYTNIDLLLT